MCAPPVAASAVSLCLTAALVMLATAVTGGNAEADAPSAFLLLALGVVLVSGVPLLAFALALLLGPGGRATEAA